MSITDSVSSGLHAAFLLARGRPDGLGFVEDDLAGARRSFWAAGLCVPAFIALRLMDWTQGGVPPHPTHDFAADLAVYAIGWAGFAVLSHPLARLLGKADSWPRFITAWNWCNVVQYMLLVLAGLPGVLGAPALLVETIELAAWGWALWIEWYATRLTLELDGVQAAGVVVVDVALGLFVAALVASMSAALGG